MKAAAAAALKVQKRSTAKSSVAPDLQTTTGPAATRDGPLRSSVFVLHLQDWMTYAPFEKPLDQLARVQIDREREQERYLERSPVFALTE